MPMTVNPLLGIYCIIVIGAASKTEPKRGYHYDVTSNDVRDAFIAGISKLRQEKDEREAMIELGIVNAEILKVIYIVCCCWIMQTLMFERFCIFGYFNVLLPFQ